MSFPFCIEFDTIYPPEFTRRLSGGRGVIYPPPATSQ